MFCPGKSVAEGSVCKSQPVLGTDYRKQTIFSGQCVFLGLSPSCLPRHPSMGNQSRPHPKRCSQSGRVSLRKLCAGCFREPLALRRHQRCLWYKCHHQGPFSADLQQLKVILTSVLFPGKSYCCFWIYLKPIFEVCSRATKRSGG